MQALLDDLGGTLTKKNVTNIRQANKTPNEIPLRLTARGFGSARNRHVGLLPLQNFDARSALAQDDTLTVMRCVFFVPPPENEW